MNRRKLAESLLWFSRRQVMDAPISRLMVAWENRFEAQGRYFIRHGMPALLEVFQEKKPATAITRAVATLDAFTYKPSDAVYNSTIPEVTAAGAMQTVRDTGAVQSYSIKSDFVQQYLKDHAVEKIGRDVDATTQGRLRDVLVRGYEQNLTRSQIVKDVKSLFAGFAKRAPQAHIRNRAELIALNELGTAYSQGALMAGVQIEQTTGQVLQKSWGLAAGACPLCQGNAANGWILLGETFSSGDDAPTAHPACKCSLMTRVRPKA